MKPTPEQAHCIEKFQTGQTLRIKAYAGTGKTSTLTLISKASPRRGTYLAFNRAIADEASRRFADTVRCSTVHSMAFRSMCKHFPIEKMTESLSPGFLAEKALYRDRDVGNGIVISPRGWAFLVIEAVRRFQRSGRSSIGDRDAVLHGKLNELDPATIINLKREVSKDARALWEQMIDPKSPMPMGHDGYLKIWALSRPRIPGDFILLDEAQDTNGVVLDLMRHQSSQVIAVGDPHQQIYEWRGALNAMTALPADLEARLSVSFRFGTQLADYATGILDILGEDVPLKGNPERESGVGTVDRPDAILTRTNGRLIEEVFDQLDAGETPHVIGGVDEILSHINAADTLMAGKPVASPLAFFGFKDWEDVKQTCNREGESAAELRRWVKLVDDYGTEDLRRSLRGLPRTEKAASVVISTGHKSKGREWGSVRLSEDFLRGVKLSDDDEGEKAPEPPKDHSAELRLFYVAATRAMQRLDVHADLTDKLSEAAKDMAKLASMAVQRRPFAATANINH